MHRRFDFLTVEEIAQRLKVSVWTIYRLLRQGRLNGHRVGGCLRVQVAELRRYLENVQTQL